MVYRVPPIPRPILINVDGDVEANAHVVESTVPRDAIKTIPGRVNIATEFGVSMIMVGNMTGRGVASW